MLNLRRQHASVGPELRAVVDRVFMSGQFLPADGVTPFEAELSRYCGGRHAVAVSSGTAALSLLLRACGIGPGDVVITVPNSFFATTEAILHAGAEPRFVDTGPTTHLMEPERVRTLLTPRTRAILPVHLYGHAVDVPALRAMLEASGRPDVLIIEDAAHACGTTLRGVRLPYGDHGIFSFNPGKNCGSVGDAGAVVTADGAVAETVRKLRDHGRRGKNTHDLVGFNMRLDRLGDAVLTLKLEYLEAWNARRREVAAAYDAAWRDLGHVTPVAPGEGVISSYHQYVVRAERRDELRAWLAARGIASGIHYPTLIPDQPAMRDVAFESANLAAARRQATEIVSLPCFPELAEDEVQEVIQAVCAFYRGCT
jgi:dTDP-4-amino-4,6-dideoxygalactose transaminase